MSGPFGLWITSTVVILIAAAIVMGGVWLIAQIISRTLKYPVDEAFLQDEPKEPDNPRAGQ